MSAALDVKANPSHLPAAQVEDIESTEGASCFEITPGCELVVSVALIAISAIASANFAIGAGVGLCFGAVVLAADKAVRWTFSLELTKFSSAANAVMSHPALIFLTLLIEPAADIGLMHLSTWAFSLILPEIVIGVFGAQIALAALVAVVAVALIHSVIAAFCCSDVFDHTDNCGVSLNLVENVVHKCVLGMLAAQFGFATAIGLSMGIIATNYITAALELQCEAQPAPDADVAI